MNTFYSLQFPGTPELFHAQLLNADTMQQHWMQTGVELQRGWFDNVSGLFSFYQEATEDLQKLQSQLFDQYIDWFKKLNNIAASSFVVAQDKAGSGASQTIVQKAAANAPVVETPRLLGWVVDDLTKIQGIGKVLQQRLYEEAVVSYLQIASWDEQEIARIENEVLGSRFVGRVVRDRWQEQARALMEG